MKALTKPERLIPYATGRRLLRLLCLFSILTISVTVHAQNKTISGQVFDNENETLIGATVSVKGTDRGTATNVDGKFTITAKNKDILEFRMVGFNTVEVVVADNAKYNIVMEPKLVGLDEVVVIGYGTESRRVLTSSISKVGGDVLQNVPVTTIGEGLKGKMPGVKVTSTNNSPGSEVEFRIRGGSSIQLSNDPLIIVDGIEQSMEGLNSSDIESFEILKDAASTAIYGARASNGVILITTKQGKKGKPVITFEASVAYQQAARQYDFLNAEEFLSVLRPAIKNSPFPGRLTGSTAAGTGNTASSIYTTRYLEEGEAVPAGYKSMADPIDPAKTLIFKDNSFKDELFRDTWWQNYYLGVNGGTDNVTYALSLGYMDDDGVAIGTGFNRYTIKANTKIKATKRIDLTFSLNYSEANKEEFDNQRNVISRGLAAAPTQKIYMEDGSPAPGYSATSPNPVFYNYYNDQSKKTTYLTLSGSLKYKLYKGLALNAQGSVYRRRYDANSFENANKYSSERTTSAVRNNLDRNKLDVFLSYRQTFKKQHSISLVGGYAYQDELSDRTTVSGYGGSTDKITTLNGATTFDPNATTGIREELRLVGFYGRLIYDYKKKYLFTATFRADGSSKFASGNRWGYFPGMSAGWIVSEEKFMKPTANVLSLMKLRVSYGQTGNNNISNYDALGSYSPSFIYDGNGGIVTDRMPNNYLKWEHTDQLDLGIDLGLFNDRITLSADYFDRRSKDLLFQKELPNTSGYNYVMYNVGAVKFYGFDLDLTTRNIQNKDFQWTSKFIWSFVKNKVLKLNPNGRDKNRIGGTNGVNPDGTTFSFGGIAEGESLYSFYGYKTAGILQTVEAADNAHYDDLASGFRGGESIKGRKSVGDYEWMDRNGDGKITDVDQFYLGVTEPTSTGSFTNTFNYKNWGLSFTVDWALGHSIYEEAYSRYFLATFAYTHSLAKDVLNTWTPENPNAKYARFVANDTGDGSNNFGRISDVFTYKGDYLCIREISLFYNLKHRKLQKIGIQNIALSLTANNLHYFTEVPGGVSPETGTSSTYSTSYYSYPPTRKYALGAKITF